MQRILKFAKYLPQFGIAPYIVTVDEAKAGYPYLDSTLLKDIPEEAKIFRTDTSEPFRLYSALLGKKSIPTGFSNESSPNAFQKFSRFVRGNFFIPDARRGWIKYAFAKACELVEGEDIDTVLTTSPPHSAQLVGLKLKNKFGIKWIADLRDPWTDIYYYDEFHHLPFAKSKDLNYEKEVLERADRIITVSKSLKSLFESKSEKIDPHKITVIPNGFDENDFDGTGTEERGEFVITYTGTLSDSYRPDVFFDAMKEVREKFPGVRFRIRFVGSLAAMTIKKVNDLSLTDIFEHINTVSHVESINYLKRSAALLLVIPEIRNDRGILTGKLFEYLAVRKPVICIGPSKGDAAEIINECDAGKVFERTMKKEITEFLSQLVEKWNRGEKLLPDNSNLKNYTRRLQTEKLSEIVNSL